MKNQYFGDKRDYFKYGLLEALTSGGLRLTCIWMLTQPIDNNDGKKRFLMHPDRSRLASFLMECASRNARDVRTIGEYFQTIGLRHFSYRDEPANYFNARNRRDYFRLIPQEALKRAIVFFDPDNGLEPKGAATDAHLRYQELAEVFQRMDSTSVAVIYQHLPRIRGAAFWPAVARRISQRLNAPVGFIAESDLAFYAVPRDPLRFDWVMNVLRAQVDRVHCSNRTLGHSLS